MILSTGLIGVAYQSLFSVSCESIKLSHRADMLLLALSSSFFCAIVTYCETGSRLLTNQTVVFIPK